MYPQEALREATAAEKLPEEVIVEAVVPVIPEETEVAADEGGDDFDSRASKYCCLVDRTLDASQVRSNQPPIVSLELLRK